MLMDSKRLGEYLKTRRVESGLSQADVSTQLGYSSAQFVSNWERGISSPPTLRLNKLLSLYEIDPEEFIDFMLDIHESSLRKMLVKRLKRNRTRGRA